jgi:predicted ATP-dependent endonuclease of OLD family
MIPSLHISGFKLFRDLELPKLGSLNLFVGKNNTGKTCLWEAVELYASSSPWDILRVASRRDPNYESHALGSPWLPILNYFHSSAGSRIRRIIIGTGRSETDFVI